MNVALRSRMTVLEFLDWAAAQPKGRYELVDGRVVAIAPERGLHNLVKMRVARALEDAVTRTGLPCTVFGDGMTVIIDEHDSREPDALVQCKELIDLDSTVADQPIIIVEVVSPSSERSDSGEKLVEYFSIKSVSHYLVVVPARRTVVHHERVRTKIETKICTSGEVELNPPGIVISVESVFASLPA